MSLRYIYGFADLIFKRNKQLLLCTNVYDDVTDFEICGFHRKTKI